MSEVEFLVGREVVEVRAEPSGGARVIFELGDKPEPALYADVGPAATLTVLSGEDRPLDASVGKVVAETSTTDGTLLLRFADGGRLRCDPAPDYEAWQVVGGTPQYLVVCDSDGDLSVFDSSYVPTRAEAEETIGLINRMTGWSVRVREVTEDGAILVEEGDETADARTESDDS